MWLNRSASQSFYVCLWGLWITFAVHYVTGEIWQSVELIGKESSLTKLTLRLLFMSFILVDKMETASLIAFFSIIRLPMQSMRKKLS